MPDSVAVLIVFAFLVLIIAFPNRRRFERAVRPREPGFLARRREARIARAAARKRARRRRHLRAVR